MANPRITVIIPTRERSGVLEYALRTVTAQDYDNLEIIVSDNFSNDGTFDTVQRANDKRIRYLNPGKRLSMSHHWEFALTHVQDGWVTFMGDDDGLLPGGIDRVASIIKQTQALAVRTEYCTFDWPGMPEHPHGQLIVPLTHGMKARSSQRWLRKALRGEVRYSQLPMIYNGGFIHLSILENIRQRMGAFFSSVNPDVYSAVAIARLTENFLYIREPLAISGTSKHSNGHSAFATNPARDANAYRKFLNEGNIPFHPAMPTLEDGGLPLSLQACTYEAYLQSAALGRDIENMDYQRQLAVILATSGKHRAMIKAWGESFARLHGLDYSSALRHSDHLRPWLQGRAFGHKMRRVLHSVVTDRLPLRNVYEASIAAAVVRVGVGRRDSLDFLGNGLRKAIRNSAVS